jgi:hypothetical protein
MITMASYHRIEQILRVGHIAIRMLNYASGLMVMLAIITANAIAEAFKTVTREDALSSSLSVMESHCMTPSHTKHLKK